jgi:PrtD family type I secretion system ABC transporter
MKAASLRAIIGRSIVDIGIFSAVINVLLLAMPLYMLQVYDRVLPASSRETLLYLSIIGVLSLVFLGLFEIIRSVYSQRVAASIDKQMGADAFGVSLSSSRGDSGEIQPLRDLATVRSFVGSRGLSTLFDLPFAPFFIILLYFVHPVLFWLALVGAVILVVVVIFNQMANGKAGADAAEQTAKANLAAQAFARNADTLRAMGMKRNVTEVWGKAFALSLQTQDRLSAINTIFSGVSKVTRMLLQLAILGVGAWLVLEGKMTAGMIFASSIISGRALQPLDQLIGSWRQTMDARRAWLRLKKALPAERLAVAEKLKLPTPQGRLTVKNLAYVPLGSPVGTEPILKRLSFEISAGEAVAVIGPSRAGKSTLARVLANAAQPSNGTVQLDGANLKTWDDDQLGQHIGYLAQDVQLLPGTIAENVSRFDLAATDERIVAAAQHAQAHEIILSQPNGYQTIVSATSLSGGERQRIGLARAFYGNPKMLVLDEPNANLDHDGEQALERALKSARQEGTTVVVVTHRMSIASSCDRVMILRNGVIDAFGPSAEVLKQMAGDNRAQTYSPASGPVEKMAPVAAFSTVSQATARWGSLPKVRGRAEHG